jgi:hypothetical protein
MKQQGTSWVVSSARWLGAGVTGGFACGLLFGGVGGRLAMLLLRLTSDPSLRGTETDDGFTIGVFSAATVFLLTVTSALGILGGLAYLVARGWFPPRWRFPAMALFFGAVGSAGVIRPEGIDFTLLSPLPLAIAMFVAIPVAYGVGMPLLVESLLREGSWIRRTRWGWLAALLPLAVANVFGAAVLGIAAVVLGLTVATPGLLRYWRSPIVTWGGRLALLAATVFSAMNVASDSVRILL